MIRLIVTSGRGPAECRLAVQGIVKAMIAEAREFGLDADEIRGKAPDRHGPGSIAVLLDGEGERGFAARWLGSVQWISPSPIRPHHRRKNWFVGIFELEMAVRPKPLAISDVRFETMRAGGAGGQHQNKTDSAVRAVHVPSGTTVVVRSERSQHRNKAQALERLAELFAISHEIALMSEKKSAQVVHDQLERGAPVRRFSGPEFRCLGR